MNVNAVIALPADVNIRPTYGIWPTYDGMASRRTTLFDCSNDDDDDVDHHNVCVHY